MRGQRLITLAVSCESRIRSSRAMFLRQGRTARGERHLPTQFRHEIEGSPMSLQPRPTVEQTIEHYLNELDAAYATTDVMTPDPMANAAIVALCRAVDNAATPQDVEALSAWATRLRLQGASDADVATMIEVIDHMRSKIGDMQ